MIKQGKWSSMKEIVYFHFGIMWESCKGSSKLSMAGKQKVVL